MNEPTKAYKVKVGNVVPKGKHDVPYLVAWPTNAQAKAELGSVTVEVSTSVWEGKSPPNSIGTGDFLVVTVKEKEAGLRALSARYFQPADRRDPNIVQ